MKLRNLLNAAALSALVCSLALTGCANTFVDDDVKSESLTSVRAATATTTATAAAGQSATASSSLPAHILTGYWQNFNNGAAVLRISDVPTSYNLICVSFADATTTPGAVTFNLDNSLGFTEAQFIADIAAVKARGQHVIVSVGGQNGTISVSDAARSDNFANSVKTLMSKYGFEGVDIDLENGVNATYMARSLRQLPAGSIITMAPQTIDMQSTGMEYFKLALAIKDILTVCNMQYYNSGSMLGYGGSVYSQGGVDFLTALATIQLENGLNQNQVGLGLPASTRGAGSGYVDPSIIIQALDRLAYGKAYGSFVPPNKYPSIRGVMTWSINWDASNNWAFSKAIGAKLNEMNGVVTDTQAPTVPASVVASNVASTSLNLAWAASSDNVGVTGYVVSWTGGSKTVSATSASITGLAASTEYAFSVKAFDAAGNYSAAATATAKTADPVIDTSAPSVPSGLALAGTTSSSVSLTWNASTDNVGVTGYQILSGTAVVANATATSATVSGLAADTSYVFAVRALDAAGNASALSASVTAKTLTDETGKATGVPGTPSIQQSSWNGEATFSITMNMWWGNNGTKFELLENDVVIDERTLTDNSPSAQALTVNIANRANGTYRYVARLTNRFGSTSSSVLSYTVTKGSGSTTDVTPPTAPSNVSVSAVTASSVTVSWGASSDNVGVTGYTVSWNGGSVTASGTGCSITGLSASTSYTVSVKAKDAAGNESAAGTVSFTTEAGGGTDYPAWALNGSYAAGAKVSYAGSVYQCLVTHVAYSENWNPVEAPTLWSKVN